MVNGVSNNWWSLGFHPKAFLENSLDKPRFIDPSGRNPIFQLPSTAKPDPKAGVCRTLPTGKHKRARVDDRLEKAQVSQTDKSMEPDHLIGTHHLKFCVYFNVFKIIDVVI